MEKGIRLDRFLAEELKITRSQTLQLIKKGLVRINGKPVRKGGYMVKKGEKVEWDLPKPEVKESSTTPNWKIQILYEDSHLLVINKPAGVVIHPAPSYRKPTLVDWLKGQGYQLSTIGGEERVGIVHRLDKGTTGALVIAKHNQAHRKLAEQLQRREMGRYYLMIINQPIGKPVIVEKPIGRNRKDRKKMGVVATGRPAKTLFIPIFKNIVLAKLFTGRTHQIRVHLKELGRWILGDRVYGKGWQGIKKRAKLISVGKKLEMETDGDGKIGNRQVEKGMLSENDKKDLDLNRLEKSRVGEQIGKEKQIGKLEVNRKIKLLKGQLNNQFESGQKGDGGKKDKKGKDRGEKEIKSDGEKWEKRKSLEDKEKIGLEWVGTDLNRRDKGKKRRERIEKEWNEKGKSWEEEEGERIFLHAYYLYFYHPINGKKIGIIAPLFPDFLEWIGDDGKRAIEQLPPLEEWTFQIEQKLSLTPYL